MVEEDIHLSLMPHINLSLFTVCRRYPEKRTANDKKSREEWLQDMRIKMKSPERSTSTLRVIRRVRRAKVWESETKGNRKKRCPFESRHEEEMRSHTHEIRYCLGATTKRKGVMMV